MNNQKKHPVALIFFNRKECLIQVASRILERWPTMAALSKAPDTEIMEVPGLSVNLAQKIVRILNGHSLED